MNSETPTLVLFDIDGTLLTSDRVGRAAFELALAETFGLADVTEGVRFAGCTDLQILQQVLLPRGYSVKAIGAAMPAFAESLARQMARLINAHQVNPLPGALDLVAALAGDARARVGLVTGNTSLSAPVKLKAAGFDPGHFPVGAYGQESADRSALPPLALQRARAYWQVDFAPERIVIVGDTPDDVICTRSVGGRAVAVLTGYSGREALALEMPFAILDDLSDRQQVETVLFGEV